MGYQSRCIVTPYTSIVHTIAKVWTTFHRNSGRAGSKNRLQHGGWRALNCSPIAKRISRCTPVCGQDPYYNTYIHFTLLHFVISHLHSAILHSHSYTIININNNYLKSPMTSIGLSPKYYTSIRVELSPKQDTFHVTSEIGWVTGYLPNRINVGLPPE